jgi:HSP20 family protein
MARFGSDPFQHHKSIGSLVTGVVPMSSFAAQQSWNPPMDVYRSGSNIVVKVAISGVKTEDVEIQYTGEALRLSGTRAESCEEGKDGFYLIEIDYGPFMREIPLPAGARGDQITATYRDGFLIVTVPLGANQDEPKREIPVR